MEQLIIPKDSRIAFTVGAGFLVKLQQSMLFLIQDRTKEELEELQVLINTDKTEDNTWQKVYVVIGTLVAAIEQAAIKSGITTSKTVDDQ